MKKTASTSQSFYSKQHHRTLTLGCYTRLTALLGTISAHRRAGGRGVRAGRQGTHGSRREVLQRRACWPSSIPPCGPETLQTNSTRMATGVGGLHCATHAQVSGSPGPAGTVPTPSATRAQRGAGVRAACVPRACYLISQPLVRVTTFRQFVKKRVVLAM